MTRHSSSSDRPLRIVGSALRRKARDRRLRLRRFVVTMAGAAACLAPMVVPATPRLIWNASASAPVGFYWMSAPDGLKPGDLVIARVPMAVRTLAARRRYLPLNVPLVKRIAAGPGAEVCALGDRLFLDGAPLVVRRLTDAAGRPMPWWSGCTTLGAGRYLLVMTNVPASFDGRYFGPSGRRDILGRATPLWTR